MIKEVIGNATLYCGDSNEILDSVDAVDSCVTDPPYGLSFMGKQWDYDVPNKELWRKVANSLKSGGHLLSFFGSRTYHRGVIPIEDAGFEIRDQLMWIYGSGFPKSHNIGKAVDKLQGNEREVVGVSENEKDFRDLGKNTKEIHGLDKLGVGVSASRKSIDITKGNSEWEGWGTALKPAHEPIVMARKPFKGSVAENVLEHGTGGINIDGCRVGIVEDDDISKKNPHTKGGFGHKDAHIYGKSDGADEYNYSLGRFPANVMHDGSEEVLEIFPQTSKSVPTKRNRKTLGSFGMPNDNTPEYDDEGTASRYFYCAKASKQDRDEGLDALDELQVSKGNYVGRDLNNPKNHLGGLQGGKGKNSHPTVKPTELMKYLCRLVTPQGGVVLDPFMGSGSTGKGALLEGFKFVGIEMEQEYFDIACARLEAVQNNIQQELFT